MLHEEDAFVGRLGISMRCMEIRSLLDEGELEQAYEMAEDLDIERVTSIVDLKVIASVYERMGKYEDAMDVLHRSYEKKPTKMAVYRLAYLCVKTENFEDAEFFYREFVDMAPNSPDKYILRYGIDRAKGVDYYVRIATLQQLKAVDYREEWGYELAKVYHKAGLYEECVRECDDLILWFGEGVIVEKAKLLKKYHTEGKSSLDAYGVFEKNLTREQVEYNREKFRFDTQDLGRQIRELAETEEQQQLKGDLERELEKTIDLRKAMIEDTEALDLLGREVHRSWGAAAPVPGREVIQIKKLRAKNEQKGFRKTKKKVPDMEEILAEEESGMDIPPIEEDWEIRESVAMQPKFQATKLQEELAKEIARFNEEDETKRELIDDYSYVPFYDEKNYEDLPVYEEELTYKEELNYEETLGYEEELVKEEPEYEEIPENEKSIEYEEILENEEEQEYEEILESEESIEYEEELVEYEEILENEEEQEREEILENKENIEYELIPESKEEQEYEEETLESKEEQEYEGETLESKEEREYEEETLESKEEQEYEEETLESEEEQEGKEETLESEEEQEYEEETLESKEQQEYEEDVEIPTYVQRDRNDDNFNVSQEMENKTENMTGEQKTMSIFRRLLGRHEKDKEVEKKEPEIQEVAEKKDPEPVPDMPEQGEARVNIVKVKSVKVKENKKQSKEQMQSANKEQKNTVSTGVVKRYMGKKTQSTFLEQDIVANNEEKIQESVEKVIETPMEKEKTESHVNMEDVWSLFPQYQHNSQICEGILSLLQSVFDGNGARNLIVTSKNPDDAIVVCANIADILYGYEVIENKQLVTISAEELNKMHLEQNYEQVKGRIMQVTGARKITADTAQSIMNMVKELGNNVIVVLNDGKPYMDDFMNEYKIMQKYFPHWIML